MTLDRWKELIEVLEDAVDNTSANYHEAKGLYNENYRPYRLAAAKREWELAQKVLLWAMESAND